MTGGAAGPEYGRYESMPSTPRRLPRFGGGLPAALVLALALSAPGGPLAADGPVTVRDDNGNVVTLAKPAERVAALPPPLGTFAVSIAGGPRRIVAVHPWSKEAMLQGTLARYFPDLRDMPTGAVGQGHMPNIEELIRLRPDLVFQLGMAGNAAVESIRAAGLPVLAINVSGNKDVNWIEMLGKGLGAEPRAGAILAWRTQVQHMIEERLRDLPAAHRPSVVHISRFRPMLSVVAGGHFRNWQIELAGGVNPAAEIPQISAVIEPEMLLVWNPDVILLNAFETGLRPDDLYRDARFSTLSAVVNRRVYAWPIGGDRWEAPTQESPLGWMWLSALLHPARFDWAMDVEMAKAHTLLYGHSPTPEEMRATLRLHDNAGSAGYERFDIR